jgi:hypothetical protein
MPTPPYDAADDIERVIFDITRHAALFTLMLPAADIIIFRASHERYYFSPFHAAASAAIFSRSAILCHTRR